MVNIDSLQFRKNKVRRPMQYAWCAATTKNFVGTNANKISRKEIVDLDIGSLCDDIMSEMSDSRGGMRCTLYLSSILISGTVKLFQEQINFIMDDCEKLMLNLLGGPNHGSQMRKKKTKAPPIPEVPSEMNIDLTPIPTPTFDPVKTFGNKNVSDRHLLSEIDFIEIQQTEESFGFNPNERELTDREMAIFFREMMGEDPQPIITEDTPQDNDQPFRAPFGINDETMPQEPAVDPIEIRPPPSRGPQAESEMIKTPKRPTPSGKPKQKSEITPESVKAAYSPPKKRFRISAPPPYDDDNDDMMIASEPTREASLPGEIPRDAGNSASPIFDFRKKKQRNISLKSLERVMNKSKDVAAILDEPILDAPEEAPVQQEPPMHIDPVDDAQMTLPDVSFHEPPPANVPPEDNAQTYSQNVPLHASPTEAAQPNANDSAHIPTQSPKVSASDLTLGSLRSFEENSRKKYIKRGNKIFADRTRQIEIEARPPDFMTLIHEERFPLRKESVDSLLNHPATMRRERFLPEYRHWSDKLLNNYYETKLALALTVPHKEKVSAKKRKKRGEECRENIPQKEETPIENMDIVQKQPHPPSRKDMGTNDQPSVEIPEEQRADFIPEDNPTNMEIFQPPIDAIPVDMQTENSENQITNDAIHDAVHEFEQPQFVQPVTEGPPLPETNDLVENAMSPKKRFKSRDDQALQNMNPGSKRNFTTNELFDIIQSFWNKLTRRDIERLGFISVEFEKVVRPGYYSVVEAGRYLYYCFLLEDKKKLYLKQHTPYDTIHLIKW